MNARLFLSLASILALALPSSASPTTPKGHLLIHGGGADEALPEQVEGGFGHAKDFGHRPEAGEHAD